MQTYIVVGMVDNMDNKTKSEVLLGATYLADNIDEIVAKIFKSEALCGLDFSHEDIKSDVISSLELIQYAFLDSSDDMNRKIENEEEIMSGDDIALINEVDLHLDEDISSALSHITSKNKRMLSNAKLTINEFNYISPQILSDGHNDIYVNPTDEDGVLYEVPVVCKNRDRLMGIYEGVKFVLTNIYNGVDPVIATSMKKWIADVKPFSSANLTDVVYKGQKMNDDVNQDYIAHLEHLIEKYESRFEMGDHGDIEFVNDEDNVNMVNDFNELADVDITCTNCLHQVEISFEEIPHQRLICESCGSVLIDYTFVDLEGIVYNDDNVTVRSRPKE